MRRPAAVRQADVARAIRGVLKGGATVHRVEIDGDGRIVVVCAEDAPPPAARPDDFAERLRRARGWVG